MINLPVILQGARRSGTIVNLVVETIQRLPSYQWNNFEECGWIGRYESTTNCYQCQYFLVHLQSCIVNFISKIWDLIYFRSLPFNIFFAFLQNTFHRKRCGATGGIKMSCHEILSFHMNLLSVAHKEICDWLLDINKSITLWTVLSRRSHE